MSKKLRKLKGRKSSKGPRHELTKAERSRGGSKGSAELWRRKRESDEAGASNSPMSEEDFKQLGREFAAGEPPPLMFATPARLLKQQAEARKYPPGVWDENKRIWKDRLAEMEGSEVPEADREEEAP